MEDRLRAFLYYIEAINTRNSQKINEKMQGLVGDIINTDKITSKISVIEKSMKESPKRKDEDSYAEWLDKVYKYAFNKSELKRCFGDIKKWCRYRNEVIHGLFNKDLDDLYNGYREHVEEGYALARKMDGFVKKLKSA